jgi:hypothetical protein
MDSDDLVTVATATTATEAELIRNALMAVGIRCEIGGEGQAGFAGVFEIDILTPAAEADEARKYLRKLRRQKAARKKKRAAARKAKAEGSEAIKKPPPQKPPPSK